MSKVNVAFQHKANSAGTISYGTTSVVSAIVGGVITGARVIHRLGDAISDTVDRKRSFGKGKNKKIKI